MGEFDWQIGDRIRRLRKMVAQLTQAEFGVEIGVSRQTVNAYERDRQKPNMRMIERICEKYDVSPFWLLTGSGGMRGSQHTDDANAEKKVTPEQKSLIDYIKADADRARKIIRLLMEGGVKHL